MAFIFEEVTEAQRLKYVVKTHLWAIDKERDISVWGGLQGGWQAYEYGVEKHVYTLRIKEKFIEFTLLEGQGSMKVAENPYIIVWDGIQSVFPEDMYGYKKSEIIALLKEGLSVYGGGYGNKFYKILLFSLIFKGHENGF